MDYDSRDMLVSSDYPLDKIVYLHTGSINFPITGTDYIINHGLPFTPLIKVVWSTSNDFSTTYGVGDGPISSNPSFAYLPQIVFAYSDSSTINLVFGNPGSVTDAYIRIYAFMPSNVNTDAEFTVSAADTFVLNTDYNYSKLYLSGITASSSTPSSVETITHGLGYYPQVEVWYTKGGLTYAMSEIALFDNSLGTESFELTTDDLILRRSPFLSGDELFHYRIYADELP